jgi:hypothetical protein
VNWDLLHQQKLTLLAIRQRQSSGSSEHDTLSGINHLLDALQDEAVDEGRWRFPDADEEQGECDDLLRM